MATKTKATPIYQETEEESAAWELAYTVQAQQDELTRLKEKMARTATNLAERLMRAAEKLQDPNASEHAVNTLGELQGNGVEFDIMCGEYGRLQSDIKTTQRMLKLAERALGKSVAEICGQATINRNVFNANNS